MVKKVKSLNKINLSRLISNQYFQGEKIKIVKYNLGFNEIFLINCGKNEYLLKIYDKKKVTRILNSEAYFRAKGVSLILPRINIENTYFVNIDRHKAAILYPYIGGKIVSRRTDYKIRLLGKILGELHALGNSHNYYKSSDPVFHQIEPEKCISDLLDISNKMKNRFVKKTIYKKISLIDKYRNTFSGLVKPEYNCYLHGDFHQRNILFSKNKFYLFDFEHSKYGNLQIELARSLFSICFQGNFNKKNYKYLRLFMSGYLESGPRIFPVSISNAIKHYFFNDLLRNSWTEEKFLVRDKNKKLLLLIYKRQNYNLQYLDKNLESFINTVVSLLRYNS